MSPIINTVAMNVDNRDFLLVDVVKSLEFVGTCTVLSCATGPSDRYPVTELFYVENIPVISLVRPSLKDSETNRLITQIGTTKNCEEHIKNRFETAAENYFSYSQNIARSIHPALELLVPGLYVCHVSKMIPTDGAGNFFWNAYTIRHELMGSAKYSGFIGKENNFTPMFLVPTKLITEYDDVSFRDKLDKIKCGKKIGGVAYHLTGLFSALLCGHNAAAAAVACEADFSCLVIEPVRDVLYESEEIAAAENRASRIIALSCPYVKIPLDKLPAGMLENFLLRRRYAKPENFSVIKSKMTGSLKSIAKKKLSRDIHEKAERLPDYSMIESGRVINELTEEQLNALLSGETSYNNKIIISDNYYNSVVTACNFLQYENFDRFLTFAIDIMSKPELNATHKYISERILNAPLNEKIYNFFKDIISGDNKNHDDIKNTAELYIRRYDEAQAAFKFQRK